MLWLWPRPVGSIAAMDAKAVRTARKPTCATVFLWGFLLFAAAYGVFLLVLGVILAVRER